MKRYMRQKSQVEIEFVQNKKGYIMLKKICFIILIGSTLLQAKQITPNEVYTQVKLIQDELHHLIKYYGIKHDHKAIMNRKMVRTPLKPRNVWQKTYEIMIKINILRQEHDLPIIEPVNMPPVSNLNPDLVYEQTQRILTEFSIFKTRMQIPTIKHNLKQFNHKTPLDVFNALSGISLAMDELNKNKVTPSYVFGENMRVYDDISLILAALKIEDQTIPAKKNLNSTPNDTANTGLKILEKIKQLQVLSGIAFVDFSDFRKKNQTPSDVFSITQMIIAELQTIKAYLNIPNITPAASQYHLKTPVEVDQLMSWNLRKLELIDSLIRR